MTNQADPFASYYVRCDQFKGDAWFVVRSDGSILPWIQHIDQTREAAEARCRELNERILRQRRRGQFN